MEEYLDTNYFIIHCSLFTTRHYFFESCKCIIFIYMALKMISDLYTLRMERGMIYNVTVQNLLGPENAANDNLQINTPRNPNHTNIHTHGLHVSSEPGADDVFHEIGTLFTFHFSSFFFCFFFF